jgi:hypothetical protein
MICPVQSPARKYSSSRFPQISTTTPPVPARQEGRIAIVTDVGLGMRWTRQRPPAALAGSQGGPWPVSDRRRGRRTALKRTAKPCGPGARGWRQVGGGVAKPYRARKTVNSPATEARGIRLRGELGISRKTTAQGMPECSDCTCMLVCALLAHFCTRDRGCSKHPAFPAPSSLVAR